MAATLVAGAGMGFWRSSRDIGGDYLTNLVYTSDGQQLVGVRRGLTSVDPRTLATQWTFDDYTQGIRALAVSPDGQMVITAGQERVQRQSNHAPAVRGELRVRDAATGQVIRELRGHQHGVNDVAVSPNGQWVISAADACSERDKASNLARWDLATGNRMVAKRTHCVTIQLPPVSPTQMPQPPPGGQSEITYPGAVFCVAVSPDGRLAYSGGSDGKIRIWDCTADLSGVVVSELNDKVGLEEIGQLVGHTESVVALRPTPNGKSIISFDTTGRGIIWSVDERKKVAMFLTGARGQRCCQSSLAMSFDGKTFATADFVAASVRDTVTGAEVWRVPVKLKRPSSVALSRDGQYLAVSGEGDFEQWDLATTTRRPVGK